jgi:hypothetical protein
MQRHAWLLLQGSPKAVQMVIKHILEGARRFKPARISDPSSQPAAQAEPRFRRWLEWPRLGIRRKDRYLIDIRPRRLPHV